MAGGGRGEGTLVSLGKVWHPPAPSPGQHQPPSTSDSSLAAETWTSAQKNELAGSQLLGCQGANQALGAPHLPPGTRAGGAGPEGLEGGRALPKACAPRETDRKKQEAESRPLRRWGHRPAGSGAAATPVSWLHEGTLGQGSRPQPSHLAFSPFFHLPGSPPCPQGSWGTDSRTQTQTPLWQGWGQT